LSGVTFISITEDWIKNRFIIWLVFVADMTHAAIGLFWAIILP